MRGWDKIRDAVLGRFEGPPSGYRSTTAGEVFNDWAEPARPARSVHVGEVGIVAARALPSGDRLPQVIDVEAIPAVVALPARNGPQRHP